MTGEPLTLVLGIVAFIAVMLLVMRSGKGG